MNKLLLTLLIITLLYYFFYYLPSQKNNISPNPTNKGTQTEELESEDSTKQNIVDCPGPRYIYGPAAQKKPNSKDN